VDKRLTKKQEEIVKSFHIKWRYEYNPQKQDAVWFYGDRHIGTATLEQDGKTYSIDIYCDGETKYVLPNRNEDGSLDFDDLDYVRYESEWTAHGVNTDDELNSFVEELWSKHSHEAHIYNSWFDLYAEIDGVSEHLDAVTHTQDDAKAQAEALLDEVFSLGGWENYLNAH
jgi:hypothetical protein